MTEHQVITKVICTLPPNFRHAVSAWDKVPDDEKTIVLLTTHLLKKETMNNIYGGQEASDSAFFMRRDGGQSPSSRRVRSRRETRHCDGCGKDGHLRKNYWHEQSSTWQEREEANTVLDGREANDFAFTSFIVHLSHPPFI